MSYPTTKFNAVYEDVVRATGRPITSIDALSVDAAERIVGLINDELERFWEYGFWPGTFKIEQRTIDATDKFILKEAAGKSVIGLIDPRECFFWDQPIPNSLEYVLCEVEDLGDRIVCFDDDCPEEPYIRFQIPAPVFTREAYGAGSTYGLGSLVYDSTTEECYASAQAANTGHAVTDAAWWTKVLFPSLARTFVKWAASAEWISEDDGKYKQAARATRELERLEDRWLPSLGVGR